MRKVYDAENYIDALIARGWLADAGVDSHFAGEHLGGAVGELPAFGLYSLWVDESLEARARAVLAELAEQRASGEALGHVDAPAGGGRFEA
jgi:hypothetical protein